MLHYGQVSKAGGKPSLVSLYYKIAARAFEPFGKETGEVSYEASLAQVWWSKLSAQKGFFLSAVEHPLCDVREPRESTSTHKTTAS